MKNLISVLRRYSYVQMGETLGAAPAPAINVEKLQEELKSVSSRANRFLWIWVATLIVIFGLDCVLLFTLMNNPKLIAGIFAATGTGFVFVVTQMRRLWHEKFVTETFIALLPAVASSDLKSIIDQLLAVILTS